MKPEQQSARSPTGDPDDLVETVQTATRSFSIARNPARETFYVMEALERSDAP